MKTVSTLPILFVISLLGGCAINYTNKDRLAQFEPGEVKIYVLVGGVNKDLSKMKCGGEMLGEEFEAYVKKEICPNADKLQLFSGFFNTHPFKGIKFTGAYAPISAPIEKDDIVELSGLLREDGSPARPNLFSRIARKAKDTGPDCQWEGGKGATSAFLSGGVVCEGWDWKKQKFAQ